MLSVSMPGANGLKGLVNNAGWQVWDSGTSSSRRNPSVSSAASGNDLSASQGDPNFRGNFGEGWSASRSPSGAWDDANGGSPQKKEFVQLQEPPLNLHHSRQRQLQSAPFSGPRIDDRSAGSKKGRFSPQRYDGTLGKDSNSSRYASATSPTAFGTSNYSAQPSAPGFDSMQSASSVDDLSISLRGMAVEDDFTVQTRQLDGSSQPAPSQLRGPTAMPQGRGPYASFPQPDYSGFYPNATGRDSYVEYPYAYGAAPSDPSLYASPHLTNAAPTIFPGPQAFSGMADLRQQTAMFYDYSVNRPPGSHFYYPAPQAMMYPPTHSPMVPSQVPNNHPATSNEKKRELSYAVQQQLASQSMMYPPVRTSPSPHGQHYGHGIDYNSQGPPMMGGVYGPTAQAIYPQGMRLGRRDGGHPVMSLRSPVLDEFRSNKARKWELRDIYGYIVEFSGDQHGSRFIQQKLETATSEEKQFVFEEIVPANILQLVQDVFGNYVIQKLFEHGTQMQKTLLANTMEGHVLHLSLQMYGCRVVQKAIEYILPDQQAAFVRELDGHVLKCVMDANGNHVIQKLIERVSPDKLGFVSSFRGSVHELSTHAYGCRVLQRCLEHLPEELARPLLDELHDYTNSLMQDQFGNYVIQFVLEHGQPHDRTQVIAKLRGQMLQMARHKFASNVCEKALICADAESRHILIEEIMMPKQDGANPVMTMMKDQFANYVLQRALQVAEGEQREALIGMVRPQLMNMRKYSSAYNKHLSSIEKLLDKSTPQSGELTVILPEVILSGRTPSIL